MHFNLVTGQSYVIASGGGVYLAMLFNMAVVAAFKLHAELHKDSLSHLDFRREIALGMLRKNARLSNSSHPGPRTPVLNSARSANHHSIVSAGSQCRCVVCKKNTT